LPHAFPNAVLALFLVITNLALSAGTAGLAVFADRLYLTLSGLNAQLEHANVRLSDRVDGLLRLFVVTPNMHKAHHSRIQRETDTNYSNIFSFWDWLCGTYTPRIDFGELRYGLDGFDDPRRQSLAGLLTMPFVKFK
jgi:sterol desaturase/sphingolipid hydroxylase (fatty acid hydroxylase superfamily)